MRQSVAAEAPVENSYFVPPATPLVACDPYFSIWSAGGALNETETTHWTGKPHRLGAQIEVDGKRYRLMGATPQSAPPLPQTDLQITPTQSIYSFAGSGVQVKLRFTTPLLPDDIDLLSRPITYVTFEVLSTDGQDHEASLQLDASAEICVNLPDQQAVAFREQLEGASLVKVGSFDQPVLQKQGDDLRIDWGYFYMAAPEHGTTAQVGAMAKLRDGEATESIQNTGPDVAEQLGCALQFKLNRVGDTPIKKWAVLVYDDLYSIQFMQKNLRPYWRRSGLDAIDLISESIRDYDSLIQRCSDFDEQLSSDLRAAGGEDYVKLGSLAYRQCFAAGKFVADTNGQPIQFSKENHSNGCIATSDVFYPMAPQFMLFGPSLAKSFLVPFMEYAASDRWKFPFAPHDLGTYPKANGQVYGGGETSADNQMPVEECGNLLLLITAVAHLEGHAHFADRYWLQVSQWAKYLRDKGFDPENQLCTDDFAGHMAHNVNLSAKAICGLGAFAQLCEMRGDNARAEEYRQVAKDFAARWIEVADDGDHFRLAFDKPGTWSQKYNLIWDRVLGLNLFPEEVFEKEMKHYQTVQNRYGLPLDSRKKYTKLDWILWSACLTGSDDDFRSLVGPVIDFLRETPNKSPMTDWYRTHDATKVGFTARPVVGGVFMRMLCEEKVWSDWAQRDKTKASGYAKMPIPPEIEHVVPVANEEATEWRYTFTNPVQAWSEAHFDDSSWKVSRSGFGTEGTPSATIGEEWSTQDIWIRKTFNLESHDTDSLQLYVHHDERAEIHINGILAATLDGYTTRYELTAISKKAQQSLRLGENVIAVHCHNTTGGQFIDVGLVRVKYPGVENKRLAKNETSPGKVNTSSDR